jgi:hypothetical protein
MNSDTLGEKDFEEFFTDKEILDLNKIENLGIIKNELILKKTNWMNLKTQLKIYTMIFNGVKKLFFFVSHDDSRFLT